MTGISVWHQRLGWNEIQSKKQIVSHFSPNTYRHVNPITSEETQINTFSAWVGTCIVLPILKALLMSTDIWTINDMSLHDIGCDKSLLGWKIGNRHMLLYASWIWKSPWKSWNACYILILNDLNWCHFCQYCPDEDDLHVDRMSSCHDVWMPEKISQQKFTWSSPWPINLHTYDTVSHICVREKEKRNWAKFRNYVQAAHYGISY